MIEIRLDPRPDVDELRALMAAAWGTPTAADFERIWGRSLAHLAAYDGARLVGYVNVASDGGVHASIFDTTVDPAYQRRGIGSRLIVEAAAVARSRGAECLHVDFEPRLAAFYFACGFVPTAAGLMRLT